MGLTARQLDYDGFVEKFKPKLTTDDCMTPPRIYEAVRDWACVEYGIDPSSIVRPFWPGGDYVRFDYPEGCVVLDNPPFSQLAAICGFYVREGIPFLLFAPSLTCLSSRSVAMRVNHIVTDCGIVYENGAEVKTSFVTSFGYPEVFRTCPELTRRVNEVSDELRMEHHRQLPKYSYPDHVLTAAMGQRYARYGIDLRVRADECAHVSRLDSQRESGKAIFGGGLLLTDAKAAERAAAERAAAERAAAERAAAHRWPLSERELALVASLGDGGADAGTEQPELPLPRRCGDGW